MNSFRLSFGDLNIMQKDIVELIPDEGIEVTVEMIDTLQEFFRSNLQAPFSVLVNKKNPYAYSFEAQQKLARLQQLHSVAAVSYTLVSRMSTEMMENSTLGIRDWDFKIFSDRETALDWLISQQDSLNTK